jgi:DNA-directed RNA polymerase subunit RPC12/RpoP
MPTVPLPCLLALGEYTLNKQAFTLIHKNINKSSTGRKRRIEYACDQCNKIYITKLKDEIRKLDPWHCRSCRTEHLWKTSEYSSALKDGITNQTRADRKIQIRDASKRFWSNPENHARMVKMLRTRDTACYSKGRMKARYSKMIAHWNTGELLACVGSYEQKFVSWCNAHQFDFQWQIPHEMPDGRKYIIDAFITSGPYANLWIEIKGFMYPIGQEKWNWFSTQHKNAELWDMPKLEQLGIL